MGLYNSVNNNNTHISDNTKLTSIIQLTNNKNIIHTHKINVNCAGYGNGRLYDTYKIKNYFVDNNNFYCELRPGKYNLIIRKVCKNNTIILGSLRLIKNKNDKIITLRNDDFIYRNKCINAFDILQNIKNDYNYCEKILLVPNN